MRKKRGVIMEEALEKCLKELLEKIKGAPVVSTIIIGIIGLLGVSALKKKDTTAQHKGNVGVTIFIFFIALFMISLAVAAAVVVIPPYFIWKKTQLKSSAKLSLITGYFLVILAAVIITSILSPRQTGAAPVMQAGASSSTVQHTESISPSQSIAPVTVVSDTAASSAPVSDAQPEYIDAKGHLAVGVKLYMPESGKWVYMFTIVKFGKLSDGSDGVYVRDETTNEEFWKQVDSMLNFQRNQGSGPAYYVRSDDPALQS